MDSSITVLVLVGFVGTSWAQVFSVGSCPEVNVKQDFVIQSYMGQWYEQQRFFAIFEAFSKCAVANYNLLDNGHVQVNNTGLFRVLGYRTAIGDAVAEDPAEPAKLGVRFSTAQPRGDYWVLDTDYESYSVVWSCSDSGFGPFKWNTQFAWILTRERAGLSDDVTSSLLQMMSNYGINTNHFSRTDQSSC